MLENAADTEDIKEAYLDFLRRRDGRNNKRISGFSGGGTAIPTNNQCGRGQHLIYQLELQVNLQFQYLILHQC